MTERTLAIIKPDAVAAGNTDKILDAIATAGFTVVAKEQQQLTDERAGEFYAEHSGKEFFAGLKAFMTSGPCVALVLQREDAIKHWRQTMGPTNSETAKAEAPESVRARFGTDGQKNATHGSDSPESAAREIKFFFPELSMDGALASQNPGAEARAYLEKKIVPTLTEGLTVMCKRMPDDPFAWLAHWLLENNPLKASDAVWTESIVGRLEAGSYFGEIALLTNKPRQVTVKADGFVKVLYLDRECFNRLCGPLFDILRRNMVQYDSYNLQMTDKEKAELMGEAPAKTEAEAEAEVAAAEAAEKAEEEAAVKEQEAATEESEANEKAKMSRARNTRRKPVFVEPVQMDSDWTPKVVEKQDTEVQRIKQILSNSIMFSHLEEEQKVVVTNAMEEKVVKLGDNIITQGEDGDFFYVIDSGTADVFVKKGEDEPKLVAEYKAGDGFGELALLHGDPRAATVTATSDCRCWALDRDTFRRILMQSSFKKQQMHEGFLENVPILAALTKYERFRLAESLQTATYNDGEIIISQGDEGGDIFYIIEKGVVTCTKRQLNC